MIVGALVLLLVGGVGTCSKRRDRQQAHQEVQWNQEGRVLHQGRQQKQPE